MKFADKMIDMLWTAAAIAVFVALECMVVFAWITPDPVATEIGRVEKIELVKSLEERQRACAYDSLRHEYAKGQPTAEQVSAAYAECDFAAGWR